MKTIKRIFKNLRWLFNHPPIDFINAEEPLICDYCKRGSDNVRNILEFYGGNTICSECRKKIDDFVYKQLK